MRRLTWGLTTAFCILVLSLSIVTVVYAASTECSVSPAVPLEVGIGAVSSSTGLTDYISQVYQFIVGSIGVVAAVMIMFNGMRWVTAGGNSENITVAKGGITNAVVGLLIALMSYVLLYAVNASLVNLVDICPTGLDFSNTSATVSWATCTGGSASECSAVSYCIYDGGCECANIGSGDTAAKVCRPIGTGVIPSGKTCQNDGNCVVPLVCQGNTETSGGTCIESASGTTCTTNDDCAGGLTCVDTDAYSSQCLQETGRSIGEYCIDATECETGVCNSMAGVHHCVAGDATTTDPCQDDDACADGYRCIDASDRCEAMLDGASCDGSDADCGPGLYCVDNDGSLGDSTCYDGSLGKNCDDNNECDSGFCAFNECTDGAVGSSCDNSSDCSGAHCGMVEGGANECI